MKPCLLFGVVAHYVVQGKKKKNAAEIMSGFVHFMRKGKNALSLKKNTTTKNIQMVTKCHLYTAGLAGISDVLFCL